jgi:hypothetical protein
MDDPEQNKFIDDVVAAALQIQLVDALGGARAADRFPGGVRPPGAASPTEIERAKDEAEALIRNPTVLERLCPALRSVSDDLEEIAKCVAKVMLPLSFGPQGIISLKVMVCGGMAVILVRAGVKTVCPQNG